VGVADSMEFESILVSKALPDGEFRQKAVIDVNRYITSLQPPASSYLRRHPFFKRDVPTPTRMSIHATRESVCREAASFKRASRKLARLVTGGRLVVSDSSQSEPVVSGLGNAQAV
jgi:hypothetical protein